MVVVVMVYLDSKGVPTAQFVEETLTSLVSKTTKFADGSTITYLLPDQPESTKIQPSEDIVEKAKQENATDADKAMEQLLTPEENIIQYTKKDPKGVVVSGYILLKDEVTGENIKPYTYKLLITIICSEEENMIDGFSYCSTKDIFGRVDTEAGGLDEDGNDLGGFYEYVWHPKLADASAFYDVDILVTKDQAQLDGTYKDYEESYKIQVI